MRQHRVQFALEKDYQVHDVVHQYREEDYASVWWSKEEYRETKKEAQAIVDGLEYGRMRIGDCTRGLEKKTRDGCIQRRLAVLDSICAVLVEQERQFQQGISGVELIRRAYLTITVKKTVEAREQGSEDVLDDETEHENECDTTIQEVTLSVKNKKRPRMIQRLFQVATSRRKGVSSNDSRIGWSACI